MLSSQEGMLVFPSPSGRRCREATDEGVIKERCAATVAIHRIALGSMDCHDLSMSSGLAMTKKGMRLAII